MKRFNYKEAADLREAVRETGQELPWKEDLSMLFTPFQFGRINMPNRMVIHPMEGYDGTFKGDPDELTRRRYRRYARGGNGLIWMEAVSVCENGRSNPRQLWLNRNTLDEFSRLTEEIKQADVPLLVQLTHSGAHAWPVSKGSKTHSDDELQYIRDAHIEAAILAEKAGMDGVDVKICHGYLFHELMTQTRENSRYSGPKLTDRLRLPAEIIAGIRETSRLTVAVRINAPDEPEEIRNLAGDPVFSQVDLWSVTAGNPYTEPWMTRPFDKPAKNAGPSPEDPLQGVLRMIELTKQFKEYSGKPVVGAGLSWLRHFFPQVAEGILVEARADLVGIGRMAFAYPDLMLDLRKHGQADPARVCTTCSGCTSRIREGQTAGCIIRDKEVYA